MFRFLVFLFLLSSCTLYKDINVEPKEGVKLERIEGREVHFTMTAKVDNPNWYGLKIKPCNLEVFVEDGFAGKICLDEKVKIKRKSESEMTVSLRGILEDGVLLRVVKYSGRESVKVNVKGQIKGGTWFYKKKFKINETKNISPKSILSMKRM